MIRFTAPDVQIDAAASDGTPSRQISGVAVPYGQAAVANGPDGPAKIMFEPGALPVEGKAPKLFMYHDSTQPVGLVTERVETPEGMMFSAKISRTAAGDEALTLALDGVLDSVSVGVNPTSYSWSSDGSTMIIKAADWLELSMVPIPAFAGATITDIAASEAAETPDETPSEQDEIVEEKSDMSEATVEASAAPEPVPTNKLFAQPKREFAMPTPGEYAAAMHIGGETFARVREAYIANVEKQQSAFRAAAGDETTGDVAGLLPTPVLAPLVQNLNFIRPTFEVFGPRAMPNGQGKSFVRPTISQHTSAATQQAEFDSVSAQTMTIADNLVSRVTVAGQVTIDMQTIDFTNPAALGLILQDLQGEYLLATDGIAVDGLIAGATDNTIAWNGTTSASLQSAIYSAAYEAAIATRFYVDTLICSAAAWKEMGALVDDVGRPVFPAVGAPGLGGYNTLGAGDATKWSGMNPLGLNIVVDPQLDASNNAEKMFVCNSQKGFEVYESQRGMMSVDVPGKLARNFSFFGYVAQFTAVPELVQLVTVSNL